MVQSRAPMPGEREALYSGDRRIQSLQPEHHLHDCMQASNQGNCKHTHHNVLQTKKSGFIGLSSFGHLVISV